jgi:hypothetical protein
MRQQRKHPDSQEVRLKWRGSVKKASEYRAHAHECRVLAKQMEQGEHRDQLMATADTWDRLAEQRDITSSYQAATDDGSFDSPETKVTGSN